METRHDNRLRNDALDYHLYLDLPATRSGVRFFSTILDPEVGPEIALLVVDQTEFVHQLVCRKLPELRLKTGVVRTSGGILLFLLWWVPPLTNGMPFALYEHLLNAAQPGVLEMLRKLIRQTHLHILLVGPGQDLLGKFEFENVFNFESLLPIVESAVQGPASDFETAIREYYQMYDLETLFQMEASGQAHAEDESSSRA